MKYAYQAELVVNEAMKRYQKVDFVLDADDQKRQWKRTK